MMFHPSKILLASGLILFAGVFVTEELDAQAMMPSFFKARQNTKRDRTNAPTVVEAATMDIDIEHNLATLLGNVVVDDQDAKITCDKMIIYLEDKSKSETETPKKSDGFTPGKETSGSDETGGKQIDRIECYGDVVITHRKDPKDVNGKDQVATSDFAVYNFKKQEIVLTGRPVLTSGTDRLDADKLVFEMNTNKVKITQGVVTYYGDTLIPGNKSAVPGKSKGEQGAKQ